MFVVHRFLHWYFIRLLFFNTEIEALYRSSLFRPLVRGDDKVGGRKKYERGLRVIIERT